MEWRLVTIFKYTSISFNKPPKLLQSFQPNFSKKSRPLAQKTTTLEIMTQKPPRWNRKNSHVLTGRCGSRTNLNFDCWRYFPMIPGQLWCQDVLKGLDRGNRSLPRSLRKKPARMLPPPKILTNGPAEKGTILKGHESSQPTHQFSGDIW